MVQAEFPPSYPTMLSLRPLRSTGITPLLRYYGPVRLPTSSPPSYAFPNDELLKGWVSQVPRPIFRDALSPITPESPAGASVQCFPVRCRLHPFRRTGHSHWCNEAESGLLYITARRFAPTRLRLW